MEEHITEEEQLLICKATCIEGCSTFCQKENKPLPTEKQPIEGNSIFNDGPGHDPNQM